METQETKLPEHARFGGSTAKCWTECTMHPTAVEGIPNESGAAALEGTIAHHVFQLVLTPKSGVEKAHDLVGKRFKQDIINRRSAVIETKAGDGVLVSEEMADAVQRAIEATLSFIALHSAVHERVELHLERRIAAPKLHKHFYGTADVLVIVRGLDGKIVRALVIDYKHGVRHFVPAETLGTKKILGEEKSVMIQNHQLGHYAVCIDEEFEGVPEIFGAIAQPRCDEVDENGNLHPHFRTTKFTAPQLKAWRQYFIQKTKECDTAPKYGPSDEACLWCVAKMYKGKRCPGIEAQVHAVVEATAPVDKEIAQLPEPENMTVDQLAVILKNSDLISMWCKSVRAYAVEQAARGVKIPGYIVGRGKPGHRKWLNEQEALDGLSLCYSKEQIMTEPTLASPTEIERRLGKEATAELKDLIVRSEGEITLIAEDSTKGKRVKKLAADTSADGFEAVT